MTTLRLRPLAEADLDDIWLHIAGYDPPAADATIDHFTKIFDLLRRQPGMGAPTTELGEGLRRFPVGNYLIFYTGETGALVVERVLHGARDIEALFE